MPDDNRGILGMSILLQSAIKTSYELITYVNTFINKVLAEKLSALDEATFAEYKKSLKTTKMEKDKTLSSEAGRFWTEIARHRYMFNRK